MMGGYGRKEAMIGGGVLAAAVIAGLVFDTLGWTLLGAALAGLGHQQRAMRAFRLWAGKPKRRPHIGNQGLQQTAESLRRTLQRSKRRAKDALGHVSRFRGVTAALPDAAVLVDGQGNIETFNDASVALLRLGRHNEGTNLAALLRHSDAIDLVKQPSQHATIEISSPFVDGQRLELRRVSVAEDRNLILARDVTALNRLLSMRQDFIANVSHELRTPLTSIVGYVEMMTDEETPVDDATLRFMVPKLASPTKRMQALVDDLLMLTRLESSPNPRPEDLLPIDMEALMGRVVEEAAGLVGVQHRINQYMESSLQVLGVEKELHSACSNLVTNAVKYSPQGGDIDIRWRKCEGGARLEVGDQGVGIPPEHISRLTERFYRVDFASARVRGGTGLGLAIVKHVLKRHNTQLEVESEVGKGSRFHCHFQSSQLQASPTPP